MNYKFQIHLKVKNKKYFKNKMNKKIINNIILNKKIKKINLNKNKFLKRLQLKILQQTYNKLKRLNKKRTLFDSNLKKI